LLQVVVEVAITAAAVALVALEQQQVCQLPLVQHTQLPWVQVVLVVLMVEMA
jgi:hypothetical protein